MKWHFFCWIVKKIIIVIVITTATITIVTIINHRASALNKTVAVPRCETGREKPLC